MDLKEGTVIAGRYRLEHELGSGGAGVVWAATHRVTGRRVALKLIAAPAHRRGAIRRRVELEARAAASLDHPHVVDVLDVFALDEATTVLVMERLDGQTLRERLEDKGPLGVEEAARLLLPAICALGAAHAAGVAHRDLKPENLFIARDKSGAETTKVLDFGIAKLLGGEEQGDTKTGMALGTPAYMAPEQGDGFGELDHRVDVWALGVILYEALSGGRPIEGRSLREVSRRLQEDGIPPLSVVAPDVPAALAELVDGMLARDPVDRVADLRPIALALAAHTDASFVPFEPPGEGAPVEQPGSHDASEGTASRTEADDHRTLEEEGVRVGDPPSRTRLSPRTALGAVAVIAAVSIGALALSASAPNEEMSSGRATISPPRPAAGPDDPGETVSTTEATSKVDAGDAAHTAEETAARVAPPGAEAPAPSSVAPAPPRPAPVARRPTAEPVAATPPPAPSPPPPAPEPAPPAPAGTPGLVEDPPF